MKSFIGIQNEFGAMKKMKRLLLVDQMTLDPQIYKIAVSIVRCSFHCI